MAEYVFTMIRASKFYGAERKVLDDITLAFLPGAKIGVLGANGAGKSTLLRIMAGVEEPSSGSAELAKGSTVGFLPQEPDLDPAKDVRGNVDDGVRPMRDLLDRFNAISAAFAEPDADFDALLAEQSKVQEQIDRHGAWELDAQLDRAMDALRLPDGDRDVTTLSGGERRRVALCRLLLSSPDLLLLDEPTNHLDAESVAWLERFLADYAGTVVAVTHDRYFLDNVAGWILELDRGRGIPYEGNYSGWLDQKSTRLAHEEKTESARQRALKAELEWVRASPKARHAKSKARVGAYEKLLAQEKNVKLDRVEIHIPAGPRLGDIVVDSEHVSKGFGDRLLVEDMTFSLPPGGIIGVIGPNGAGKTTLFRMISGEEQPDSGELRVGETVELAYVDQSREGLEPGNNVWKEISGGHDTIALGNREVNSRQYVSWFNFKGSDQQKRVGDLFGRRAEPRPSREAAPLGREPAAPGRADERPRRGHPARARGRVAGLRRLRRRDLARPLVPRSRRDAHPRLRGRFSGHVVRGELRGVRGLGARDARRGGARAAPDHLQTARPAGRLVTLRPWPKAQTNPRSSARRPRRSR